MSCKTHDKLLWAAVQTTLWYSAKQIKV